MVLRSTFTRSSGAVRPMLLVIVMVFANVVAKAQTTIFTYQGTLSDGGVPANGNYDLEFKLYDTVTVGTGTQQGPTVQRLNVTVTSGAFTVQLDFGAGPFPGADRFLEIAARPAGPGSFTVLSPRQQITSAPYALKSLNATTADGLSVACLNCVTSGQIQSVLGSQVNGTIPVSSVPAGSGNYIQNGTTPQAANFNITGDGSASGTLAGKTVNATTEYDMGGSRVIGTLGVDSIYVGLNAGLSNTGNNNAFFGSYAGRNNASGVTNSFFGHFAGANNTTGSNNAFFGVSAGASNVGASGNAFFGASAGQSNTAVGNAFFGGFAGQSTTSGADNAFFGFQTGQFNSVGIRNAFFGSNAGRNNTSSANSFFGYGAGAVNTSGDHNSFFGISSGESNTTGFENSFFGDRAGQSNTEGWNNSFFGAFTGYQNTTGRYNAFFGDSAGSFNTTGEDNSFFGSSAGLGNTTGQFNSFFGSDAGRSNVSAQQNSFFGTSAGRGTTLGGKNAFFGDFAGYLNTTGVQNTFIGSEAGEANTTGANNTALGMGADVLAKNLQYATAIGAGAVVPSSNTIALGRSTGLDTVRIPGKLVIETLSAATATHLCINASNEVSSCSSSLRYKRNVSPLTSGLDLVRRLRPVIFDWRPTGERDLGLIAEEVEKVDPLLVTRDKTGAIQGVKYDQVSAVLINAIKEQQAQIEKQQSQIESLLKLVCFDHPDSPPCKRGSNGRLASAAARKRTLQRITAAR